MAFVKMEDKVENSKMQIEIIDIKEQEDGSAILTIDMCSDALKLFASIGLLKVLTDATEKVVAANEP